MAWGITRTAKDVNSIETLITREGIDAALRSISNDGMPLTESALSNIKGIIVQGIKMHSAQRRKFKGFAAKRNTGSLIGVVLRALLQVALLSCVYKYGVHTSRQSNQLKLEPVSVETPNIELSSSNGKPPALSGLRLR